MSYRTKMLILDGHGKVLACRHGYSFVLPDLEVESGRLGISLTRAVRSQLQMEIFCLVLPTHLQNNFQTVCVQSHKNVLPYDCVWIEPEQLNVDEQTKTAIRSTMSEVIATTAGFGGQHWYGQVVAWLQQELSRMGYELQALEQWNGRIGGVLLRVVTSGPNFWFKAVSDFNLREMQIAQLLAEKHPSRFPLVLATHPQWNAFLLENVRGRELYEIDDLETWKTVAATLAEVQGEWTSRGKELLEARAADLRALTILPRLPAFFSHVNEAMSRQKKETPLILSPHQVSGMRNQLERLCEEVGMLPFASGLANADFSPHNTLITSAGPVFIDWAEACVSLPLIAGEYLWNRMAVELPERRSWQADLRMTYLSCWAERYGTETVVRAAELLPSFSILAVAMFYHERECQGPSPYDSYLRSLTRKLHYEIKNLQFHSLTMPAY
jgi:hypothetical protein